MNKDLQVKSFSGYSQADRKVVSISTNDSVQAVHKGEDIIRHISDFNTKIDLTSLYYDMTNKGYAIIFDNSELYNNCIPKVGMDVNELAECLESRNFDVDIRLNFHTSEIFEELHKIKEEKTNISCLLVIVMSVGKHWHQISTHNGFYDSDKLWYGFLGAMIGIPKIFFIQTVQDYKDEQPIGNDVADGMTKFSNDLKLKIPLAADMLFVFSTSLDCRHGLKLDARPRSSWYLTHLCEALNEEKNDNMDLLQMLTNIFGIIYNKEETNGSQQMPQIESMLTKLVKFNRVKSFSGYSQADRKVVSISTNDSVQAVHKGEKSVKNISDFNTKIDLTSLYYDMTNKGYAIIFDNSELYNNCIPKVGMDVNELAECLESRNFDVGIRLNFHMSEIFEELHKIKEEKTNISCLLVIVMSVGKHWRLISAHDGFYSDDKLWHGFLGTMIGIPKIFLIQTVQGYKQVQPIGEDVTDGFFDFFSFKNLKLKIPLAADILLVFSTSLDRRPMVKLNPVPRSCWYITYLCEALNEKNNDNMDLLQILTEIIGIIYDEVETDELQQIPQIESMLTKLVKFDRVIK